MFIDAIANCILQISISNFSLLVYGTTNDFCILNMNPVTLINSIISSSSLKCSLIFYVDIMLSFSICISLIPFSRLLHSYENSVEANSDEVKW